VLNQNQADHSNLVGEVAVYRKMEEDRMVEGPEVEVEETLQLRPGED